MASSKNKLRLGIIITAITVAGALLVYCIACPIKLRCSCIEYLKLDSYEWKLFSDECRQLQTNEQSGDNQVFGELPDVQSMTAGEYTRVWYYVDLSSHKLGALTECSLIFTEVDNSAHRFVYSPSPAFNETVPAFGRYLLSRSIYVNRSGMTDEELKELLQNVRISVYYQQNGKLMTKEVSASTDTVRPAVLD